LLLVACCLLLVVDKIFSIFIVCLAFTVLIYDMSSYKDLEIYKLSFELAKRIHYASLKLPSFELHEQGSQVRRSSKSVKDQIAEGYGRRRYKPEFIKLLIYTQSSCDETTSQLEMIITLYPNIRDFEELLPEYDILGKKINSYIQYVESDWKR
jgi:four helix bundle protein